MELVPLQVVGRGVGTVMVRVRGRARVPVRVVCRGGGTATGTCMHEERVSFMHHDGSFSQPRCQS